MTMAVAVNLFHNNAKEGFPPEHIAISQMNATVSSFVGDAEPSDDLTMLCLKIS